MADRTKGASTGRLAEIRPTFFVCDPNLRLAGDMYFGPLPERLRFDGAERAPESELPVDTEYLERLSQL